MPRSTPDPTTLERAREQRDAHVAAGRFGAALPAARRMIELTASGPAGEAREARASFVELVLRSCEWQHHAEAARAAEELLALSSSPIEEAEASLLLGRARLAGVPARSDAIQPLALAAERFEAIEGGCGTRTSRALERLAHALARAQRWGEAANALDRALPVLESELDEAALYRALVFLAQARAASGRPDDALGALERARALRPLEGIALGALGHALVSTGRLEEALGVARAVAGENIGAGLAIEARRRAALGDRVAALAFHDLSRVCGDDSYLESFAPPPPSCEATERALLAVDVEIARLVFDRTRFDFDRRGSVTITLLVEVPAASSVSRALVEHVVSRSIVYNARAEDRYGGGWDDSSWVPLAHRARTADRSDIAAAVQASSARPATRVLELAPRWAIPALWTAARGPLRALTEAELRAL